MNNNFIDALIREDIEGVKVVPKTDFHNHSAFGTRVEHVEKWANTSLSRPPSRMNGLGSMLSYAREILNPHINCPEGFEFTAESAIQDAIEDGVSVLEMSLGIRFALFYPDPVKGFTAFVNSLKAKYKNEVIFRPELGFIREDCSNQELFALIEACVETEVFCSVDIYGHESACMPEVFCPLFRRAKDRGMKLKAHVGEFGNAEMVRRTVESLELDAVQHGIGAAGSCKVMKWLSDHQIQLNICPTSNVMLGAVESLERHPIRKLYDHGICVTINTDDLMIFDQSVSQEYLNLYRAKVFSAQELDGIREASLKS